MRCAAIGACDVPAIAPLYFLGFCLLGSRILSANMGGKFFIALPLVVFHHFLERIAGEWPRRIEHPCAFGATAALKRGCSIQVSVRSAATLGRLAMCE